MCARLFVRGCVSTCVSVCMCGCMDQALYMGGLCSRRSASQDEHPATPHSGPPSPPVTPRRPTLTHLSDLELEGIAAGFGSLAAEACIAELSAEGAAIEIYRRHRIGLRRHC